MLVICGIFVSCIIIDLIGTTNVEPELDSLPLMGHFKIPLLQPPPPAATSVNYY